jgi:hypothetical protein
MLGDPNSRRRRWEEKSAIFSDLVLDPGHERMQPNRIRRKWYAAFACATAQVIADCPEPQRTLRHGYGMG